MSHHISRSFNKDLEDLRNNVLAMGGFVESQLANAIKAMVSGDSALDLKVAHDDYKVNHFEVSIDEECSRILATRGPAASDLRLIVAIIKAISELERIGDHAKNICEYVIYMVQGHREDMLGELALGGAPDCKRRRKKVTRKCRFTTLC